MNKLNSLAVTLLSWAIVMLSAEMAHAVLCYPDIDGDGFGDASALGVDQPSCATGSVDNNFDCNDTDAMIHPGAPEFCNGLDDDCDGTADDNPVDAPTWHQDLDGDGFGDPATADIACQAPAGTVADATDCNDGVAAIHPTAPELCNGIDDDCDGTADDNPVDALTWHQDLDGDGFGDPATEDIACQAPAGTVADGTDCNDGVAAIHPTAPELCNGTDDDCDGAVDEGCGGCLVVMTGDVNVSGARTSADIIAMVNFVFKGGAAPMPCQAAGDVNCNGTVTSADIIAMVNHVFKGGPAPCDVCQLIPGTWSCP